MINTKKCKTKGELYASKKPLFYTGSLPIFGSCLLNKRIMFCLCLNNKKLEIIVIAQLYTGSNAHHPQQIAIKEAIIAPSEEILLITTTPIHTTINNKPNCQENANKTPRAVATPLPPRKRKNAGYKCPKNTDTITVAIPIDKILICLAIKTAINPFNTSPNKVKIAGNLPPIRKTLVVPGLLEPQALGSGKRNNLQIIMALETEPNK